MALMPAADSTFEFDGRQLVVRELAPTTTDARQLLTLTNRVAGEGWLGIDSLAAGVDEARRFISRSLGHGSILLGLFDGDNLIGHLGIDRIAEGGCSFDGSSSVTGTLVLFLDKPYRGGGLGYQLLARGCRLARECGFHKLWVATRADNKAAIGLYHKLGFRPVPSSSTSSTSSTSSASSASSTSPTSPAALGPLASPGSPAVIYLETML